MCNKKLEGHVRTWVADRGFGTIGYAVNGELCFAWFSFSYMLQLIPRGHDIALGTPVLFNLSESKLPTKRRLPVAQNVEIVGTSQKGVSNEGGAR